MLLIAKMSALCISMVIWIFHVTCYVWWKSGHVVQLMTVSYMLTQPMDLYASSLFSSMPIQFRHSCSVLSHRMMQALLFFYPSWQFNLCLQSHTWKPSITAVPQSFCTFVDCQPWSTYSDRVPNFSLCSVVNLISSAVL